jgi:hypothetical protein
MRIKLFLMLFITSTALNAADRKIEILDVAGLLIQLSVVENSDINNNVKRICGEDAVIIQTKNCIKKNLTHCEMKDKITNYCFDGIEILNDSLGGSANKALMEMICNENVSDMLPPVPIAFGNCMQQGQNIIQIDFECNCEDLSGKLAFFCTKK